jgi:hypothetical protein
MVGDKELNIHYEYNSDQVLMDQIWNHAIDLGFQDIFIKEYKHSMLDDHTPFVERGLPAVDIIDFDYIYWHTTSDTLDKVSSESLEAVGRTLQSWILSLE